MSVNLSKSSIPKKKLYHMKKKILKKIINEGCGREQKFEFCFDSSVRIFCSICLKTAQVNLHTKKTLSLQFCPGFEKLSAGRDALQLCRAAISDDPMTGKTTQYVRLYGQLGDRLIDYATVFLDILTIIYGHQNANAAH